VVSGVVVVVVVVGICNRSQMRTRTCTCLIFGVSIGLYLARNGIFDRSKFKVTHDMSPTISGWLLVKYCDEYVCLSVCLTAALLENREAELHQILPTIQSPPSVRLFPLCLSNRLIFDLDLCMCIVDDHSSPEIEGQRQRSRSILTLLNPKPNPNPKTNPSSRPTPTR